MRRVALIVVTKCKGVCKRKHPAGGAGRWMLTRKTVRERSPYPLIGGLIMLRAIRMLLANMVGE